MLNSIKKYSKTFFFKVLIGIIIMPFLFWGMGDVFSGGSQNVVAKIDSEKVSTRDFVNYLRSLNLSDQERKNISKTNLIERILSDYIGKRVLALELEDMNVVISDETLKDIIINDKTFFKDNKFSRTEYEKFLITSKLTAPFFETNIAAQEKKRQLLSFLSDGVKIPSFLVQYEYNKENQTKEIEFINLKKFYNKPIAEKKIKEVFDQNKELYSEVLKNFKYAELTPINIIGENSFNENFFNKINEIENKTLDNINFDKLVSDYNLDSKDTGLINNKGFSSLGKKVNVIDEKVIISFFNIKNQQSIEFLNINDKFYIVKLVKSSKVINDINDKKVREKIKAQINIENKVIENNKIAKAIAEGKFNKAGMKAFAEKNELIVEVSILKEIKENKVFSPGVIKRIFETNDKSVNLITDNMLKNNFIVYTNKTKLPKIKKQNKDYKKFELEAKLRLANNIYNIYDLSLNKKYKVEINNKTLNRIKNSF